MQNVFACVGMRQSEKNVETNEGDTEGKAVIDFARDA